MKLKKQVMNGYLLCSGLRLPAKKRSRYLGFNCIKWSKIKKKSKQFDRSHLFTKELSSSPAKGTIDLLLLNLVEETLVAGLVDAQRKVHRADRHFNSLTRWLELFKNFFDFVKWHEFATTVTVMNQTKQWTTLNESSLDEWRQQNDCIWQMIFPCNSHLKWPTSYMESKLPQGSQFRALKHWDWGNGDTSFRYFRFMASSPSGGGGLIKRFNFRIAALELQFSHCWNSIYQLVI